MLISSDQYDLTQVVNFLSIFSYDGWNKAIFLNRNLKFDNIPIMIPFLGSDQNERLQSYLNDIADQMELNY